MSKQKQVTFDIAKMAVYNDDKRIVRAGWGKGVYLEKGTVWFFMMRTVDNKLITWMPTDEDTSAKDWVILD
ncbi:MAG: DUF2829 domain-containing protein [Bacilli bacterium]|nr:DUF2829 domain-containing protein [Bacilli bacterium]